MYIFDGNVSKKIRGVFCSIDLYIKSSKYELSAPACFLIDFLFLFYTSTRGEKTPYCKYFKKSTDQMFLANYK